MTQSLGAVNNTASSRNEHSINWRLSYLRFFEAESSSGFAQYLIPAPLNYATGDAHMMQANAKSNPLCNLGGALSAGPEGVALVR